MAALSARLQSLADLVPILDAPDADFGLESGLLSRIARRAAAFLAETGC